jgi:hypothetical protein
VVLLGAVSRLLPQKKPHNGTKRPSFILLKNSHFVPLRASTEGIFQRSLFSRNLCPDPGKTKKLNRQDISRRMLLLKTKEEVPGF